jgi:DNA-binding GntR family transcriptional regulator
MSQVGSTSAADTYDRLRRAIMRLELAPGAQVSEASLMDEFGCSKASVRAALVRLRSEALVLAQPRRGHVVAPLTMRDVMEVYDLRLALEPPAAVAAAPRIAEAELQRLAGLTEPDTELDEADEFERFITANTTIHLGIVRAAGNGRTTQIVERLLDDSERARRVALRSGAADGGARAREELRSVLAALGSRDGERAAELLAAAIKAFRQDLSEALGRAALDAPLPIRPPPAPDAA